MYLRWQSRKRQTPAAGGWCDEVRDKAGKTVYNERGSFLRTRKRADGSIGQDVHWKAVIVENVRIDGQPRQQHIALLAGITESEIEIDDRRRFFWDAVHERLDRLGNRISIEDRRRIEKAIALKVPPLSRKEHAASVKRSQEFRTEWNMPPIDYKPYRPPT
jgi:hypothetical protein